MLIVTADHSHTFTLGGNANRGNKIYGITSKNWPQRQNTSDINLTYTSLLYGNGPGGLKKIRNRNLTNKETGEYNLNFFKRILIIVTLKYM
jgi:alkaline phosphatase